MRNEVQWSRQVQNFVSALAPEPKRKLRLAIRGLAEDRGEIKPLVDELTGYSRLRVGDFRVIYREAFEKGKAVRKCLFAERRDMSMKFSVKWSSTTYALNRSDFGQPCRPPEATLEQAKLLASRNPFCQRIADPCRALTWQEPKSQVHSRNFHEPFASRISPYLVKDLSPEPMNDQYQFQQAIFAPRTTPVSTRSEVMGHVYRGN